MARSAKLNKLRLEYDSLVKLADCSRRRIIVEPAVVQPGRPPESYVVTYKCRGIVGVDGERAPIYGDEHKASVYLPHGYPLEPPDVNMLTPVWHPNIKYQPPYHVCINEVDTWWSGRHLGDLALWVGELIQYKRYHAEWVDPFPDDPEVAEWVREYAEPRNIVGRCKPVDTTPLAPGWSIIHDYRRIKLGTPSVIGGESGVSPQQARTAAEPSAGVEADGPARRWRIKLGERHDEKD